MNVKTKQCLTCSGVIIKARWEGKTRWAGHKYCSLRCRPSWSKGLTQEDERVAKYVNAGVATRFKPKQTLGSANTNWKGEEASYVAKHMWVKYHYGKPQECEHCGTTEKRMYHWANISRTFKRERADWLRLCVPCHKRYDINRQKGAI